MTTTLIAKRTRVGGRIETEGDVMVDGRVEGTILAAGCVTVGLTGVAVSEIQAGRAVVLGIVIGNISAGERVDVAANARIVGDVRAPVVSVAPSGMIEGRIDRLDRPTPPLDPSTTSASQSQRPTLRIRGAPVVRPARPDLGPDAAEAPRAPASRQTGELGAAPRLRTPDPTVVPLPPRPPARVPLTPRRIHGD
jgi:cytoskeletal protein CcmA (bactofilin family)